MGAKEDRSEGNLDTSHGYRDRFDYDASYFFVICTCTAEIYIPGVFIAS